jgi:prevent-host-death family protein
MSTKIMPVSDLRRQTSKVLKSVREGGDVVYITQHGRPTAVLVDYEQYELMRAQLEDAADLASIKAATTEPERDYEAFLAEMDFSDDAD